MNAIPVIFDTKNDNLIASFEWNSSHQTGTRASKPAIYCQADECNPGETLQSPQWRLRQG
jgi:hypothetical protein